MNHVKLPTVPLRSVDWGVQQELHTRLDIRLLVPFCWFTRITLREFS